MNNLEKDLSEYLKRIGEKKKMNDDDRAKLTAIYHKLDKLQAFLLGQYTATLDSNILNAQQDALNIAIDIDALRRK